MAGAICLEAPMKVTHEAIDPELRTAGRIAKLLFRPSQPFWRVLHAAGRLLAGRNISGLRCDQRWIPSTEGGPDVRVRIYRPLAAPAGGGLPGVLFLHGGGYALGKPEMSAARIALLMATRPCVIVAPDYRKSLDAPYPAALDDCHSALLWLRDHAGELGVRADRLIVFGESAGGGLTAALVLRARDRGDVEIAFQMPLYPMIDDRMTTGSCRDNDAPLWNATHNRLAWQLYLGDLADGAVPPYAAPARATDHAGLPPGATLVGTLDPFRDETIAWVENHRNAGIPFELRLFDGCYHGFERLAPKARVSREAEDFIQEQFAAAVDGCSKVGKSAT
jgi:acetyl esterase/lipase